MNSTEIAETIFSQTESLQNRHLPYLTNRNGFTVTEIEEDRIKGRRDRGEHLECSISRQMIENYATALAGGRPVHIETALEGSGNERSALEAIVAHLPNAGHIRDGGVSGRPGKHVIWFNQQAHPLGELRDVTDDWSALAGIENGEFEESIPNSNLSRALLTKPFLILTGPSGTGKTRGAVELAKAVCGVDAQALVAVGADWTDNRHVLGYLNPLESIEQDDETYPIYETTPILDLLLHANANRDEPHVLILDEMNLSHVERYFADFLSAMELEDKENALKLHTAGKAMTRTVTEVPGSIDFPTNLFVIGTVNIDETTYMFSPKVLDRANVIEIHAGETALGNYLRKTEGGEEGETARDYGISFMEAARVIQEEADHPQLPELPDAVRQAASDRLMAVFRIMKRGRGEFGFRTGKEVMAYLRTAHFLAGPNAVARVAWTADENWHDALDAQILQKILPKLHGSRSRLAPLLGALAQYCGTGEEAFAMEYFPEGSNPAKRTLQDARGITAPKFKNSYDKLESMITVLVEEQFVSFIC